MKPEFLDLKAGDKVRCIETVIFCNGTRHSKGQTITLTERTQYYYNHPINHKYYEVVEKSDRNIKD
jgi:hypothetical protein